MEPEKNSKKKDELPIKEKMIKTQTPAKFVGSPEDAVPFAWRNPLALTEIKKASKKFRALTVEDARRASKMLIPVEE